MILALKIVLISGAYATGKWEGIIEIDSSSLLEDLHFAIQSALDFDNDHLYEFFSARTERSRERISFNDENGALYERTVESIFPLPEKQRLYYLFDYGDYWIFRITKTRTMKLVPDSHPVYPRLVFEDGERPEQYPSAED